MSTYWSQNGFQCPPGVKILFRQRWQGGSTRARRGKLSVLVPAQIKLGAERRAC